VTRSLASGIRAGLPGLAGNGGVRFLGNGRPAGRGATPGDGHNVKRPQPATAVDADALRRRVLTAIENGERLTGETLAAGSACRHGPAAAGSRPRSRTVRIRRTRPLGASNATGPSSVRLFDAGKCAEATQPRDAGPRAQPAHGQHPGDRPA